MTVCKIQRQQKVNDKNKSENRTTRRKREKIRSLKCMEFVVGNENNDAPAA